MMWPEQEQQQHVVRWAGIVRSPVWFMYLFTLITLVVYFVFLSLGVTDMVHDHHAPTISDLIIKSRMSTITFALMVYLHSWVLTIYFLLITEYLDMNNVWHLRQYYIMMFFSVGYIMALIFLTYIPTDTFPSSHRLLATLSFCAALLSCYLYTSELGTKLKYELSYGQKPLILLEFIFFCAIVVSGGLFQFANSNLSEYFFVFFILLDKPVKIYLMSKMRLLNTAAHILRLEYVCDTYMVQVSK